MLRSPAARLGAAVRGPGWAWTHGADYVGVGPNRSAALDADGAGGPRT